MYVNRLKKKKKKQLYFIILNFYKFKDKKIQTQSLKNFLKLNLKIVLNYTSNFGFDVKNEIHD